MYEKKYQFFYFIVCNQPAANRETPEIVITIALSALHHHLHGIICVDIGTIMYHCEVTDFLPDNALYSKVHTSTAKVHLSTHCADTGV